MANFTTMKLGETVFKFDVDAKELTVSKTVLSLDEVEALGDFLLEVLSTQGYTPRIRPLTITSIEVGEV